MYVVRHDRLTRQVIFSVSWWSTHWYATARFEPLNFAWIFSWRVRLNFQVKGWSWTTPIGVRIFRPLSYLANRLHNFIALSDDKHWFVRDSSLWSLSKQDDCIQNTTVVCGNVANVILILLIWCHCCYVTTYRSCNLGCNYVRANSDQSELSLTNRCLSSLGGVYIYIAITSCMMLQ